MHFSGGFGNQLFQLALAQQTKSTISNKIRVFCLYVDNYQTDRKSTECREAFKYIRTIAKGKGIKFIRIKVGELWYLKLFWYFTVSIWVKLRIIRTTVFFWPFSFNFEEFINLVVTKKRPILIKGYFQDLLSLKVGVKDVVDWLIESDLIQRYATYDSKNYIAVHIRRGDYAQTNLGMLDDEYYSKIFRKQELSNLDVDIYVDDKSEIEALYSQWPKYDLYDSKRKSWQTVFSDLCDYRVIYAANSTFSLWAGLVVVKRGGACFIPRPWTKFEAIMSVDVEGFSYLEASYL